ncbi:hypothetical protein RLIN73S_01935 [Rhodanobacter lindaniclasticus]
MLRPDGDLRMRSAPTELIPASALRFKGLRNVYRRDGFGSDFVAVAPRHAQGMRRMRWMRRMGCDRSAGYDGRASCIGCVECAGRVGRTRGTGYND